MQPAPCSHKARTELVTPKLSPTNEKQITLTNGLDLPDIYSRPQQKRCVQHSPEASNCNSRADILRHGNSKSDVTMSSRKNSHLNEMQRHHTNQSETKGSPTEPQHKNSTTKKKAFPIQTVIGTTLQGQAKLKMTLSKHNIRDVSPIPVGRRVNEKSPKLHQGITMQIQHEKTNSSITVQLGINNTE